MTPFIGLAGLVGTGISALSGSIGNLFTGEGRAGRQAKRQARRSARKQKRKQKRAPVSAIRKAAAGTLDPGRITPTTEGVTFLQKATIWIKTNWYWPAGAAALIALILILVASKKKGKKKLARARMARARKAKASKSNPSRKKSGNPGKKSGNPGNFAARTRRVNREWKKAKASGSKIGRKAAWAKWG